MDERKKRNKRYCIAFGCLNTNKMVPDLSLFSLPKDTERRQEWLTILDRQDLLGKEDLDFKYKNYEVCSDHFEESSMTTRTHLKSDAVPKRSKNNISLKGTSTTTYEPVDDSKLSNVKKLKETISIETQTEIEEIPIPSEEEIRKRKISQLVVSIDSWAVTPDPELDQSCESQLPKKPKLSNELYTTTDRDTDTETETDPDSETEDLQPKRNIHPTKDGIIKQLRNENSKLRVQNRNLERRFTKVINILKELQNKGLL